SFLSHLRLAPVALAPELRLYQAAEPIGLWEQTEGEYRSDQPPPFWAFPWAGGQALARYLLDHPDEVADRRVLDLAAGSGLVAIAASRSGAAEVQAVDVDRLAASAIELNAEANGVAVTAVCADVLDNHITEIGEVDLVTAGDVFYSQAMSQRVLRFLKRARGAGVAALVGDPGRAYFPAGVFEHVTSYDVPVSKALESATVLRTRVYRLSAPRAEDTPP
ncbi:MAG TPA: 50S ribosomal protein L11 methyltransferase, partial [Micromonosporaceae bacterium]|nr:50S ribosomal protein L11 methyltransferase [Micromonosporaceae bacterium]